MSDPLPAPASILDIQRSADGHREQLVGRNSSKASVAIAETHNVSAQGGAYWSPRALIPAANPIPYPFPSL